MGDPQLNTDKIMKKVKEADIAERAFERQQKFGEDKVTARKIAEKEAKY